MFHFKILYLNKLQVLKYKYYNDKIPGKKNCGFGQKKAVFVLKQLKLQFINTYLDQP